MYILIAYLLFIVCMSLVAFGMYYDDKNKAKKGQWRTKEATLLGIGFFGGAAGALAGMKLFRHKTKHWYFWAVNIAGLLWQAALLVFLAVKLIQAE
jgi:uncharacterized membrane protein YsdA (DUF1294 family)